MNAVTEYTVEIFGAKGWEISAITEEWDVALVIFNHERGRGDARLSTYTPNGIGHEYGPDDITAP